jgi:hypothetical protein
MTFGITCSRVTICTVLVCIDMMMHRDFTCHLKQYGANRPADLDLRAGILVSQRCCRRTLTLQTSGDTDIDVSIISLVRPIRFSTEP